MSVEHVYRRKSALESQWQHIQEHIESTDYLEHSQLNVLIEAAESAFDEVEERTGDLRRTDQQNPTDDQLSRVYRPVIRQLDSTQRRLRDLQQAILYIEVNQYQQESYTERLSYVNGVCEEISNQFEFSVSFLPVVWDGYAAFDIQREDFYAIHVPRDSSPIPGGPIIAHEFGHIVSDFLDTSSLHDFRDELQEFLEEWPEKRRFLVENTWRIWFDEFLCDACGLLTFGPAYLIALTERLYHRDPYNIPKQQVYEHPPNALRYEFVRELGERSLPDPLYARTSHSRQAFESHLDYTVSTPPAEYDSWFSENLLNTIEGIVRFKLNSDFDSLCSNLLDDSLSTPPTSQKYRYESNIELLNT